jgi:hypothetical protein
MLTVSGKISVTLCMILSPQIFIHCLFAEVSFF